MRRLGACFLLLAVFLVAAQARAKDFTSPKNFKLTYPDDWTLAVPEQLAKTDAGATKASAAAAGGVAAKITGPRGRKLTPNLMITIMPAPFPVMDDKNANELVKATENGLARLGFKMRAVKTARMTIDRNEALSVALEGSAPKLDEPVRQWVVYVSGRTQTYLVACTALKSQWAKTVPSFDAIIKSLRVDINGFKGGVLTCPKGFSIKYPDGWVVASAKQLAAFPEAETLDAVLYGPREQDTPTIVTVVVTPAKLPSDEKDKTAVQELLKDVKTRTGKAGTKVLKVKTSWIRVGKLPALSMDFEVTPTQTDKTLHVWQVGVAGKQQGYIVSCEAAPSGWAKLAPTFKAMVDSLRIDLEIPK
jgi:hypothetical protein